MLSENNLSAFKKIKAIILDIDGVLTDGSLLVFENGEQVRKFNIKDGFAMVTAIKEGIQIIVISAGNYEGVRSRLEYLGVQHIQLGVKDKKSVLQKYMSDFGWKKDEMLYMGDDLPDYEAIQMVGLPTCPADACAEIINLCHYISPKKGGEGAVRDVIEKVLKLQNKWKWS